MESLGYNEETIAAMELGLCGGIGPVLGRILIEHFGSATAVFGAAPAALHQIPGLSNKVQYNIIHSAKSHLDEAREYAKKHIANGISVVSISEKNYPYRLKELADAPLCLYFKGEIDWDAPRILGVIGTRKPTPHGSHEAKKMVEDMRPFNPVIVSGMAYGVDAIAHRTALETGQTTWAVLAHGLEKIYPAAPQAFAKQMLASRGGLISEFPIYTKMHPDYFPRRNRIVAGLCDAILVIESGLKGGSMITARIAHSYNRDVFSVPGRPSDLASVGCNFLIQKNMAHIVQNANDIGESMNWENQNPTSNNQNSQQLNLFQQLNPIEKQVMQWLVEGINHPNKMLEKHQWTASKISMALLDLELKGLIYSTAGNQYKPNN
jgi:DNA processing protein